MSLKLLINPLSTPTNDAQWTNLVAREDVAAIGGGVNMRIFTLTNGSTTARPLVAQGSIIEVGGSWYQADSDTALSDDVGLVDGTVHIKLVPGAGSPDPNTVIPTLTSDVIPTWDAEKGGWYDGADKFLPFEMERSGAITKVYTAKCEWINQDTSVKICNDGSVGLDGSLTVGGSGSFGSGLGVGGTVVATNVNTGNGAVECYAMNQDVETSDVVTFSGAILSTARTLSATNTTYNTVFDTLSPSVPSTGNVCILSGGLFDNTLGGTSNRYHTFTKIRRVDSSTVGISYHYFALNGAISGSGEFLCANSDATVFNGFFSGTTGIRLS